MARLVRSKDLQLTLGKKMKQLKRPPGSIKVGDHVTWKEKEKKYYGVVFSVGREYLQIIYLKGGLRKRGRKVTLEQNSKFSTTLRKHKLVTKVKLLKDIRRWPIEAVLLWYLVYFKRKGSQWHTRHITNVLSGKYEEMDNSVEGVLNEFVSSTRKDEIWKSRQNTKEVWVRDNLDIFGPEAKEVVRDRGRAPSPQSTGREPRRPGSTLGYGAPPRPHRNRRPPGLADEEREETERGEISVFDMMFDEVVNEVAPEARPDYDDEDYGDEL